MSCDLAHPLNPEISDHIGRIDAVVHCAALSSAWGSKTQFIQANVIGTKTALKLAKAAGAARFINISSPTVYFAPRDQLDVSETMALPRPINAYAATKVEAEKIALNDPDIATINLRPRGIYGAGDTTLLPRLRRAAQMGPLPLLRGGNASIDLTHVSDAVGVICAALDAGPSANGETINISSGETRKITQIVEAVCKASGISVRWKPVPWRIAMGAARASELIAHLRHTETEPRLTRYKAGLFAFRQSLNISKSKHLLGWEPQVDFERGLALTLEGRSNQ
jgi:nucleoside-diphosphate-sugar epimerase